MSYSGPSDGTPYLHETGGGFVALPSAEDLPNQGLPLREIAHTVVGGVAFAVATIAGTEIRSQLGEVIGDVEAAQAVVSAAAGSGLHEVVVEVAGSTISGSPGMVSADLAMRHDMAVQSDTVLSPLIWIATAGTAVLTLHFLNNLAQASGGWRHLLGYLRATPRTDLES